MAELSRGAQAELPSEFDDEDVIGTLDTVRVLAADGSFAPTESAERFLPYLERLTEADHQRFYRDMVTVRRFDAEAGHLQRQGQLALWVPSHGQEAAQVGSGRAARAQDTIFPAYREHAVGMIRGIDPLDIIRMLRGITHGGWDPKKHGNFRLYTLVIASQTLHATGYAMGISLDGAPTGDPDVDEAVLVYFGDGATSQGDASEALVWAASYQTPQVFFLQNNHWAISVPVSRQSRVPLVQRASGFGIPATQVDGNDVLAAYAVTTHYLDEARAGRGPGYIEALTYRIGAHTTSDDPTRYRASRELAYWEARDPIARFRRYLEAQGADGAFFSDVDAEAADLASDVRRRMLELTDPDPAMITQHVYTDDHPVTSAQHAWMRAYEATFEEGSE